MHIMDTLYMWIYTLVLISGGEYFLYFKVRILPVISVYF